MKKGNIGVRDGPLVQTVPAFKNSGDIMKKGGKGKPKLKLKGDMHKGALSKKDMHRGK